MLREILGALTGKSRHSKAGKEHKAKYKRDKAKKEQEGKKAKKKEEGKKEYAYFRLKGLENKKSEQIKALMKEFKSNKKRK